jgi:hypothetical protein
MSVVMPTGDQEAAFRHKELLATRDMQAGTFLSAWFSLRDANDYLQRL